MVLLVYTQPRDNIVAGSGRVSSSGGRCSMDMFRVQQVFGAEVESRDFVEVAVRIRHLPTHINGHKREILAYDGVTLRIWYLPCREYGWILT